MNDHTTRSKAIEKLGELIEDIRIAMLTTSEANGMLRSRPMATQITPFDGQLWFFTAASAEKVNQIANDQHVNLSYSAPEDNRYVSVSGVARLVRDQDKIEDLWSPFVKAWFPKGKSDPDLALLCVDVQQAEYWDAGSGTMVQLVGLVKSLVTGSAPTAANTRS